MTIKLAEFFVLRTPLLPFTELIDWGRDLRAPQADPAALEAALADDRQRLRDRLRRIVERPVVREALFLASTSLDERLPEWFENSEGAEGQKVERSLVAYFTRMSARATPFGLFAGHSTGASGDDTQLRLKHLEGYKRYGRLDCDYLLQLTTDLGQSSDNRTALVYRPNTALYRLAGRLRYLKTTFASDHDYRLSAVEPTAHLEVVLERAAKGETLDALAGALVCSTKLTLGAAQKYVAALVDAQILISDLAPAITGSDPIVDVIAQLRANENTVAVAETLEHVSSALKNLSSVKLGVTSGRYRELAEALPGLPSKPAMSRLFQVDLVKPAHATLGRAVRDELVRGIDLLVRIGGAGRVDRFAPFREAFIERYGGVEVPLHEVVDPDIGIGFEIPSSSISPLLEGLDIAGAAPATRPRSSSTSAVRDTFLFQKVEEVVRAGGLEIVLEDGNLEKLERKDRPLLPDSGCVLAKLAATSDEALAAGDFRLLIVGVTGPTCGKILGRFCHADEELTRRLRRQLQEEHALRPDVIFAEVVHQPAAERVGNVLLRPLLRDYEIPYLGRSGAPIEQQISVEDLFVSVRGNRVVLRSRKLQREVMPRLSAAHVHGSPSSLPVYRFLSGLHAQDGVLGSIGEFGWGALKEATFLPRVRVGRLVLSLARWKLAESTLASLAQTRGAARYSAVQKLRRDRNVPRWVALADEDNLLPIDLDNALSIDTFVGLTRNRSSVTLTEVFEPDALCASGPEGKFAHELVIPFVHHAPDTPLKQPAPLIPATRERVKRSFPPGSEWIYVKLYTGVATADRVLLKMAAVVREPVASGSVHSWFFVRYADPHHHIRLRLYGEPSRLLTEVLPAILQAAEGMTSTRQIWKIQLDSYEREVERFGGDEGIILSERLFHVDSEGVLSVLGALQEPYGPDARWRLCLRGMDMLLDDLQFDLESKLTIVRKARASFGKEFGVDVHVERQLGQRFRTERLALEALLEPSNDAQSPLQWGIGALVERSVKVRPTAAALHEAAALGRLSTPPATLASSYLHMFANRLLRDAARAHELVLYDFLGRLYEGKLARQKGGNVVRNHRAPQQLIV